MNVQMDYIAEPAQRPVVRLRLLVGVLAIVAVCAVAGVGVLGLNDRAGSQTVRRAAPPAGPTRLGDTPAPEAAQRAVAAGAGWQLLAEGRGGRVCAVVAFAAGGSGSGCALPTEVEPLVLGESEGYGIHLVSGITVAQAKTVVFELSDGRSVSVEALHHPGLGGYRFFVTDYSPDIVGVTAYSADGGVAASASAQSLRFITERQGQ